MAWRTFFQQYLHHVVSHWVTQLLVSHGSLSDWLIIGSLSDWLVVGSLSDWSVIGSLSDWLVVGSLSHWLVSGSLSDWLVLRSLCDWSVIGSLSDWLVVGSLSDWLVDGSLHLNYSWPLSTVKTEISPSLAKFGDPVVPGQDVVKVLSQSVVQVEKTERETYQLNVRAETHMFENNPFRWALLEVSLYGLRLAGKSSQH